MQDISISGFVVLSILLAAWLFKEARRAFWIYVLLLFGISLGFFLFLDRFSLQQFLSFNGRLGWWKVFGEIFTQNPVTGFGFGSVNSVAKAIKGMPRHLHQEYLQILFEGGIVGLMLMVWFLKDFLSIKTKSGFLFKLMFSGFLLSCCFNYPAHLWIPAIYACIAYSCLIVIRERENVSNPKAD